MNSATNMNGENKSINGAPKPFLKWAGGKRQILPELSAFMPSQYNTYIEPFVGGGAVFFHLGPQKSILIDNNPDLINCYNVVKNNVEDLIESLKQHKNEKEYYYKIRNVDRDAKSFSRWSDVEKASRLIYMNRCCYNGLYRVNSKGQFNVPFGRYKNPKICDDANLRAASEALQSAEIYQDGFERCLEHAKKGDFLYLDPPYVPLSNTAYFTSYTKDAFNLESQEKLFNTFKELDKRGCKVMLSNSYCDYIVDLYGEFRQEILMANRAINSNAQKRGKIKEILILNS
ncbi:MAG: DNA adenine methylase [Candidatus Hodarchaeota archaeon]